MASWTPALADGVARGEAVGAQPFSWTGYYFGGQLGGGLNKTDFSNPYGADLFGGTVRAPEMTIGLQGGYNWQALGSSWVFGLEGEVIASDGSGSNTCFAFSGEYISSNCTTSPDFTGTLAGRIGYAAGPSGRTLLYLKGGTAVTHNDVAATANNGFDGEPFGKSSRSLTRWGWLIGAGLEQAVAPAWSVKFEYDYIGLGDGDLVTPESISVTPARDVTPVGSAVSGIDQSQQLVKVGLNYRFGADPHAFDYAAGSPSIRPASYASSGWSFQPALRYWYSLGRFQKDLPISNSASSTHLISRLTYDDLAANSGEFYGRVDTPWNVFAKGYVGGGGIDGGHMNDEDWGDDGDSTQGIAYSNTYSSLKNTGMNYGAIDLGYNVMKGSAYRAGLFVGYARVHEQYAAITCYQLASPATQSSCYEPIFGPVITETDTWNAVRLGATADVWLAPRLQLTADAAYLPRTWFTGRDNHWQRDIVIEEKGTGHGGQLELLLSYYLTDDFSLGVGGRYWAMWTTNGSDIFDSSETNRSDTYKYERYGVFLQGAYTFDTCCAAVAAIK